MSLADGIHIFLPGTKLEKHIAFFLIDSILSFKFSHYWIYFFSTEK